MSQGEDLTGQRFGRWVVVARIDHRRHLCRCDCGTEKAVWTRHLRTGESMACGCRRHETRTNLSHGLTRTPEYRSWQHMKERCFNPDASQFAYYGGRGITVCDYWRHNFTAWLKDMGPRPPGTSLGRIDNDGDYEPGNCRWETRTEQNRNTRTSRRLAHDGQTLTLAEWAERTGLPKLAIWKRLNRGWDIARALTTPIR